MTDQERERIFQTAVRQLARMDAERKARLATLADLWKPGQSPRELTPARSTTSRRRSKTNAMGEEPVRQVHDDIDAAMPTLPEGFDRWELINKDWEHGRIVQTWTRDGREQR